MSRLDLLRAAQFLVEWSELPEPLPLWPRCTECGLTYEASKGHTCPLDEPV